MTDKKNKNKKTAPKEATQTGAEPTKKITKKRRQRTFKFDIRRMLLAIGEQKGRSFMITANALETINSKIVHLVDMLSTQINQLGLQKGTGMTVNVDVVAGATRLVVRNDLGIELCESSKDAVNTYWGSFKRTAKKIPKYNK